MRELMNSMPLRFCAVIRITKPLIMKNSGTPMEPKAKICVSRVGCEGQCVAWKSTTQAAAVKRSKSSSGIRSRSMSFRVGRVSRRLQPSSAKLGQGGEVPPAPDM
jgi:hypothetical protein